MPNERSYHETTSYSRRSTGGGRMMRAPQPVPFKDYTGLKRTMLPEPGNLPAQPLGRLLLAPRPAATGGLDLAAVSRLLASSHAVTAVAGRGGKFYFRSVPSAGALYPAELYLAASGIGGLDDGVYHHHILRWDLTRLRTGSVFEGDAPGLLLPIAAVFGRSAWKYGARAYRYCLMDCGHLAEALALAARAMGFHARVHVPDDTRHLDDLVRVDGQGEAVVCAVEVREKRLEPSAPMLGPFEKDVIPGGPDLADIPEIAAVHAASMGPGASASGVRVTGADLGYAPVDPQALPDEEGAATSPFAETVYARRSRRSYGPGMDSAQTTSMLAMLTGTPDHACRLAVMAGGARGLATGLHLVDGEARQIALVRQGDARGELAGACLGQRFVGWGSLIALMLTDLDALQGRFGPGGYRRALLDSGRMGHRAYLGATALGLSACGVGAFFDDETADVLGLSKTSRLLYLVVTG